MGEITEFPITTKQVSELTVATNIADGDEVIVRQSGIDKRATGTVLKTYTNSGLTKSDVGLDQVDNTSDARKPLLLSLGVI